MGMPNLAARSPDAGAGPNPGPGKAPPPPGLASPNPAEEPEVGSAEAGQWSSGLSAQTQRHEGSPWQHLELALLQGGQ